MFSSPEKIIELLTELGERLAARGIEGELYLVGGGAMLLGYNRRTVTKDLDAIYLPAEEIDEIVKEMSLEYSEFVIAGSWLNSQVAPLLPRVKDSRAWEALKIPGLSVQVASAQHLLAMKARAGRGIRDYEDVAVLADILELERIDQVWEICEDVWGPDMIRPEVVEVLTQYLISRGLR